MSEWLIRKADHRFLRPMSDPEVVALIEAGEIKPEDEICPASGYWFSIKEVEEVKKHFGDVHLQAMIPKASEITSTTHTAALLQIEGLELGPLSDPKPIRSPKKSKKSEGLVVNPQAAKPTAPAEPQLDDVLITRRARLMGFTLVLIFFGTLALLWLGSR